MSLSERLFGTPASASDDSDPADADADAGEEEQLAATQSNPYDVEPKGERRSGFFSSYIDPILGRDEQSKTSRSRTGVDVSVPQEHLNTRYNEYVKTKPLVKAPLLIFNDAVAEPGWMVEAKIDGESDEDMTEALELWGQNCVVHAQEPGHDIAKLVEQIPEKRRAKGTIFIEKASTRGDSQSIGGLMMLDPASVKVFSRENQPILIQPDDDVPPDHPRTEDGKAAAYVQYHDSLGFKDKESIAFSADEILKITYDPEEGSAFGTPLWVTIRDNIDRLTQMLEDRGASIRMNVQPWRTISNENWTYEEANRFLKKHFDGDVSTWLESDSKKKNTFAGRVDAIPHQIDVEEHSADVPDIDDAIMDEVRAIFSVMPVSRYLVAYEERINQFVVEPQKERDDRDADKERNVIREYLEPVFQEKADELADGDEYQGEVTWKIEQPVDENPLSRDSFDAEQWATLAEPLLNAGAPLSVAYELAGMDREEFEGEDWESDPLELDEHDDRVQEQFEAATESEADDQS